MMTREPLIPTPIRSLFDAVCDELATVEQLRELELILTNDEQTRRIFLDYCGLHVDLHYAIGGQQSLEVIQENVRAEATQAPTTPLLSPGFFPAAFHSTISFFSQEIPFALLIATVVTSLGLLIGSLVYVTHHKQIANDLSQPTPLVGFDRKVALSDVQFVGRVTGMADVQWSDNDTATVSGANVSLGRKYALASGLMEITYDTGAKVILQGPCTYEVESPAGGFLSIGKLTARLETKGEGGREKAEESPNRKPALSTIHYPLFTITTPSATVTDLGTEFGVEVSKEGTTTSHVFRGTVEVQMLTVDGKAKGNAKVLHENQSTRVEKDSSKQGGGHVTVFATPAKQAGFVREIPKPSIKILDLVDVVAGGDGFSGRRNAGIDPTDGQIVDRSKGFLIGDGQYHRVEAMPFVDGVFIPDGRTGRVQTDSAGHIFTEFPATANRTSGQIWAAGAIAGQPSANTLHGSGLNGSKLDGVDYASPGHGLLAMHANKAVTFDLEVIRKANPGYEPLRFCAMTGNTEMESDRGEAVYADVWVLVDGQVRFRRRQINGYNGAFSVIIPIVKNEHFLTLAATDGENGIAADWIIFGDPRLELAPTKATAGSNPQKTR